MIARNDRI